MEADRTISRFTVDVGALPIGIVSGPDGNLWFTDAFMGKIGRLSPGAALSMFTVPREGAPGNIVVGSDGALWFAQQNAELSSIGRITTSGEFRFYELPVPSDLRSIAAGPDGNIWFADGTNHAIGRLTPAGDITTFPLPSLDRVPFGIAAGPDGNIWFTELPGRVGRLVIPRAAP